MANTEVKAKPRDKMGTINLYSIRMFFEDFFIAVSVDDDTQFLNDAIKPYVHFKGFCWIPLWDFTKQLLGVEMSWSHVSNESNINLVFDSDLEDHEKHFTGGQLALLDTYFDILDISYSKEYGSILVSVRM